MACQNAYYNDACRKASEAFAKQTNIEQNITSMEGQGKLLAKGVAKDYLGDRSIRYAGLLYIGYHMYATKSAKFELPNCGIADHIETQVNTTSGQLDFKWHFQ